MGLQEKLHNLCKDDYQLTKPGYRYQRDIYPINGALLLCCWAFGSTEMTEVYLPLSYLKSKLIQITKADCSGFWQLSSNTKVVRSSQLLSQSAACTFTNLFTKEPFCFFWDVSKNVFVEMLKLITEYKFLTGRLQLIGHTTTC